MWTKNKQKPTMDVPSVLLVQVGIVLMALFSTGTLSMTVTVSPQNTAVVRGNDLVLYCSTTAVTPGRSWNFGTSQKCNELFCLSPYWIWQPTDGLEYNIHVNVTNLTLAEGGKYTFNQLPDEAAAYVIVLESPPVISNSTSSSGVVEGNAVEFSCTLTHSDLTNLQGIHPVLTWSYLNGTVIPGTINNSTISVTSRISVNVTRSGLPSLKCSTTFTSPVSPPANTATNAPNCTNCDSLTTAITNVLYAPTNLSVSPNGGDVWQYSTVSANAPANPNATYVWTELSSDTSYITQVLSINYAGINVTYLCNASNPFGSVSSFHTYNVTATTTPSTTQSHSTAATTTNSSIPPCAVNCGDDTTVTIIIIVVCTVVPVITGVAVFLICYFWPGSLWYDRCHRGAAVSPPASTAHVDGGRE